MYALLAWRHVDVHHYSHVRTHCFILFMYVYIYIYYSFAGILIQHLVPLLASCLK